MAAQKPVPWCNSEVETFLCLLADARIQRELDGANRNERVFQELARLMHDAHGYTRTSRQCREKLKKLKSDYRTFQEHRNRGWSRRKDWKWFRHMDAIYGVRPASNAGETGLNWATGLDTMVEYETFSIHDASSPASLADSPTPPTPAPTELVPASTPEPLPAPPVGLPVPGPAPTPVPGPDSTPQPSQHRILRGKRKRGRTGTEPDLSSVLADMRAEDALNRTHRDQHLRLLLNDSRKAREQETLLRREEMAQTAAFNQALLGVLDQLVKTMMDRRS